MASNTIYFKSVNCIASKRRSREALTYVAHRVTLIIFHNNLSLASDYRNFATNLYLTVARKLNTILMLLVFFKDRYILT